MTTKQEIRNAFDTTKTDKGFLHAYDSMYSEVFDKIGTPSTILEIGIKQGRSLAAWKILFPDAAVTGVDIKEAPIHKGALGCRIIIGDSMRPKTREEIGRWYDLIIDDGDHRPEAQWQTFENLKAAWSRAYVIEDVVGIEHAQLLMKRLQDKGFSNLALYGSALTDVPIQMSGKQQLVSFYSIVVYR